MYTRDITKLYVAGEGIFYQGRILKMNSYESMLLYEYTDILLGNRPNFSTILFEGNSDSRQKMALQVFRYAIHMFLGCKDIKAIPALLTKEMIEKMQLTKVISYINFPEELDKNKDYFYIAHLLYPGIIPYDQKNLSIRIYKEILDGKLVKFPKKYLDGIPGKKRAEYCFEYMLSHFCNFKSEVEMYNYFTTTQGMATIKKYKLQQACISMYEHPLDFMHASLPDGQKDDFLYSFFKHRLMSQKSAREIRKNKKELKSKKKE